MLVASAASSQASAETLVGVVCQLLDQHSAMEATQFYSTMLQGNVLDCLSYHDAFALFQLAIEHASVDLLLVLLRLGLHTSSTDKHSGKELTIAILRCIVDEGNATLLEAFLSSDHVHLDQIKTQTADDDARSILHVAVEQDNTDLVRVLLRHDGLVDMEAADAEIGWTALHFAVEWDSVSMQTLLLHCGVDINSRARDGTTPLLLAVQFGHVASAMLLIESGADLSITDSTGATPLHTAAREGHAALVEYLVHRGAALNTRDAEGRTPLHAAAFFDESAARFARGVGDTQVAVVQTLLMHGANMHARDAHGNSVLHTAQQGRFDIIVDLLLAHQREKPRTIVY